MLQHQHVNVLVSTTPKLEDRTAAANGFQFGSRPLWAHDPGVGRSIGATKMECESQAIAWALFLAHGHMVLLLQKG